MKSLGNDVFPYVEKDIGALFCNLALRYGNPHLVIILIPLAIIWVLVHAYIVTKGQGPIVVYHAEEIILGGYVERRHKLIIHYVV